MRQVDVSAVVLGVLSVVIQMTALRELGTALYGNELVISFTFFGWLIGVGAGSYFGGTIAGREISPSRGSALVIVAGFAAPGVIALAGLLRVIFRIPAGVMVDPLAAAGMSMMVILPVSVLLGFLFPLLTRMEGGTAERVYLLETIGFAAGGAAITFFLFPCFGNLQIAMFVLVLSLATAMFYARHRLWYMLSLFLVVGTFPFVSQAADVISHFQWPGYGVQTYHSRYGEIKTLRRGPEISLFENGAHITTTGDIQNSEESVHYALLSHPSPRRLLLIGGGAGGVLQEALKHPGLTIDYVELDEKLVTVGRAAIPSFDAVLNDPAVDLFLDDGRQFVSRARRETYDVIVLNLSDPLSLQLNRYFTREFFQQVARALRHDGIFSLTVTSSENYLNREGRQYLRSIQTTLRSVFAGVDSIPGAEQIFLASQSPERVSADPLVLAQRLKDRAITTQFVRDYYFNFRLSPLRIDDNRRRLAEAGEINTDTRPVTFVNAVAFWSTHFGSTFSKTVDRAREWLWTVNVLPLVFLALGLSLKGRAKSQLMAFNAGFGQMLWQLAVILLFQALLGYVLTAIGVLSACFMLGVYVGGKFIERRAIAGSWLLIAGALFSVFLALLFIRPDLSGSSVVVFGGLSFLSGFVGGAQFLHAMGGRDERAGSVYAMDVTGGATAALLGGVLMFPLWGIPQTLVFCALLQLSLLTLFRR